MNLNKNDWLRKNQYGELVVLQLKGEEHIVEVYFKGKLMERGKLIVRGDETEDEALNNLGKKLSQKYCGDGRPDTKKQKIISTPIKRRLQPIKEEPIKEKPKGVLTIKEVAKILNTNERKIRNLITRKEILLEKKNGRVLVKTFQIEKLKNLIEELKKKEEGKIYTFSQAAFILGFSYWDIKNWAKAGKIAFEKIKGRKFIPKSVVDELKNKGFTREEKRLRLKDVVEILKVHPSTVWDWGKKGKIKIIRTPKGAPYVLESEVKRIQKVIREDPQFAYLRARREKVKKLK